MHVLIVTLGSHGDVHPFLALGRALQARGHTCAVATHPYFNPDIDAAGIETCAVNADFAFEDLLRDPDLFHRFRGPGVVLRMFGSSLASIVAALRRHITERRPDVILAHHVALGARWVAAEAKIPCAIGVLAPFAWNAPDDPVPILQFAPGAWRRRQARLLGTLFDPVIRSLSDAWGNRVRARVGFSPGSNLLWNEFRGGDRNLALWSTAFRGPLPSDPPQGVICGFPWYDGPSRSELDPDLERFLDAGEPPIVFTLGSAAVYTARDFFAMAAAACDRLGQRAVLLVGRGVAPPPLRSERVKAVAWAAHSLLFPRARITVQHGGIGSTAQALRAGRPTLVIPHAHDQFNNAVRVDLLGVGSMLARHRVTVDRLAHSLDTLVRDECCRVAACELGSRLARDDGAQAAVREIELLFGTSERRRAA